MIRLRGHHLLRLEKFLEGEELFYHPSKGEEFKILEKEIFEKISGSEVEVMVTDCMDDLCEPCLAKENNCYSYATMLYDHQIIKKCGFEVGESYCFKEIKGMLSNSNI